MSRYPFVINKSKAVVIEAASLESALDRVLAKNPSKWVKTTHARNIQTYLNNMDLINAQKEAKATSKSKKNELVYIVLVDDEFEVRTGDKVDIDKDDIYSTWRNGIKIDAPEGKKQEPTELPPLQKGKKQEVKIINETKTTNEMKKVSKKSAVKKVSTKKAAAPKKAKKAASKGSREFEPGKVVSISIADMRKNMKKGFYYRDPQGVRQTEKYMATRANQDWVREGMHEYKEEK